MKRLFTERHGGARPRVSEVLDETTRNGLWNLLSARIDEEWFGLLFPSKCADGYVYAGTDFDKLRGAMAAYGLLWPGVPIDSQNLPSDGQVFDVVEFAYEHIAEAKDPSYHSYMSHSHYSYDQGIGRAKFEQDVNRILERNGIALELKHGEVIRIAPAVLHESLGQALFKTGDSELDRLLEASREKFLNRSLDVRREALEKLWDSWERLKTVEAGKDKKDSTNALLNKAVGEHNLRERLDREAMELTQIGNRFMIRHTETDKIPIVESAHVDYLYHRMFSMIRLLLQTTGRGG
jgi:hypothetical protein